MPNIHQMKESKYLKKEDCPTPLLLTITGCHEQNVAMDNKPPELKWCLTFREHTKPLILNGTNAQLIAQFMDSEETDDWIGKKVVLYHDPTVSFGQKLVGGIRCRAPRNQPPAPARPAPAPRRPAPPPQQAEPEREDNQDYGDAYEGDQNH